MSAKIRVGLVGIAGYGDLYLKTLLDRQLCPDVDLVGCVETAPHRSRRLDALHSLNIPVHATLPALFEQNGVELAIIATPIHLHAPHSCFALHAGANVLCEKPLAGSLEDAAKMSTAAHQSGGFVAIGYQ